MHAIFPFLVAAAVITSCNNQQSTSADTASDKKDTVATMDNQDRWQSLFDGKTTKGWHSYGKNTAGSAWKVKDGVLYLDSAKQANGKPHDGGDLLTDEEFENYDLKLEWKISPKGNSGIILNIKEDPSKYDESWYTGLEMQVLDDNGHPDGKIPKHLAGDLYDLISSSAKAAKPVGEWNLVEVVHNKGKLDLFLNDTKVVSTTIGDDDWKQMVSNSKFKERKDFGTFPGGRIALQDHGDAVYYRNIMIKKL